MSIRNYINSDGSFNFRHIKSKKLQVDNIKHEVNNNNNYQITDHEGHHYLSFDNNKNLHTSSIKTYVDNIDAKHNVNNNVHRVNHLQLKAQVDSLASSVPTDDNFEDLQERVAELENYITELKKLIKSLSLSCNLLNDNNENFDFTNLL